MFVKPCSRCPLRKTCEIRAAKMKAIKGLHFTSVSFGCDVLPGLYTPGMRVKATLGVGREEFQADATVMAWKLSKVLVCVDEEFSADPEWEQRYYDADRPSQLKGTIQHAVVKLYPDRITATGEVVPICGRCRKPMHVTIPGWECDKGGDEQVPCVAGDPEKWWADKVAEAKADYYHA